MRKNQTAEDLTGKSIEELARDLEAGCAGPRLEKLDTTPALYAVVCAGNEWSLSSHLEYKLELLCAGLLLMRNRTSAAQSLDHNFQQVWMSNSSRANRERGKIMLSGAYIFLSKSRREAGRLYALCNTGKTKRSYIPKAFFLVNGLTCGSTEPRVPLDMGAAHALLKRMDNFVQQGAAPWLRNLLIGAINQSRTVAAAASGVLKRARPDRSPPPQLDMARSLGGSGTAGQSRRGLLFCMHWLAMGGAERFAVQLIRLCKQQGYRVLLTADRPSPDAWAISELVDEFIPLYDYCCADSASAFLNYLIQSRNIALLHIHHSDLAYRACAEIRESNPGLCVMDTLHIVEKTHSGRYPRISGEHCDRHMDLHHVISLHLQDYLVSEFSVAREKIRLGYLVEQGPSDTTAASKRDFRQRHNIDENALTVAFVGRFSRQKRPEVFVDMVHAMTTGARRELDANGDKIAYLMFGDGPLKNRCIRRASRRGILGRIRFMGEFTPDENLFDGIDVLVMPSENEGLALVSFEATAAGTTVLFTDVGAQSELLCAESLVENHGDIAAAFAEKLARVVADPAYRRHLVEKAQMRLVELGKANGYRICMDIYERHGGGPKAFVDESAVL